MLVQDFVTDVLSQRAWERGGIRAPHKSLAVLYALGQAARGTRLSRYRDAEGSIVALLEKFGPQRESHHPDQPVWRLASKDGIRTRFWNLTNAEQVRTDASNNPRIKDLREYVSFGLCDEITDLIEAQPAIGRYIGERIAEQLVPATIREELLAEVKLDAVEDNPWLSLPIDGEPDPLARERERVERSRRDARFRARVLDAYDYRCAVCSVQPCMNGKAFGLEAAHIHWVQAGGRDETQNGICLCRMHHIALDRGAIGFDADCRVAVSSRLNSSAETETLFNRFAGVRMQLPHNNADHPWETAVSWHRTQVFKP